MKTITNITQDLTQLSAYLDTILREAKVSSPYYLYCGKERGYIRLYKKETGNAANRAYLKNTDMHELKELAQNTYHSALLKAAEEEKETVAKALKLLKEAPDVDFVYSKLGEPIRQLVKPFSETTDEVIEKWQKQRQSKPVSDELPFYTAKGEHVRSKSEIIIADTLNSEGIPYVYEPLKLLDMESSFAQHPDFEVVNRKTGRFFLWEHFGMMDNPDYCSKAILKLEEYAEHGYFEGINLITTFESSKRPLGTMYVRSLVEKFLK